MESPLEQSKRSEEVRLLYLSYTNYLLTRFKVKSYVSTPEKATKNAILYIPDAFGLELSNNKL